MRDLLIMNKYPRAGRSKTRLGKDIGYEASAQFAKHMLEDMVAVASNACRVTVACPSSDIDDFRTAYPDWNLYQRSGESLNLGLSDSFRNIYNENRAEKVIVVTGDIVLSENELDSWFSHLDSSNIIVGPTFDLRFYLVGFDKKYGNKFASYLNKSPSFVNFSTACIRTIAKAPEVRIMKPKIDIDTLDDLRSVSIPDHYAGTQEYVRQQGYI